MNQKFRAACIAAGLALLAPATASADEFVIGIINELTGPGAELGIGSQLAVEPFVEEFNKSGGVNGAPLKVIFRDDESNPQKAVAAAYELLQRQRVSVIMGTNLTNVAFAVAPIINQAKIPFIVFGTGTPLIDPVKFPYSFRTSTSTDTEAGVLVDYVMKSGRYHKPGLMVDSTALGQTGEKALRAAYAKYGVEPLTAVYNPFDTDVTSAVATLQHEGVDVMFVWGTTFATVAISAERIGFHPAVFGQLGVHSQTFINLAGEAGADWAGTYYRAMSYTLADPVSAEHRAFAAKLRAYWGARATPGTVPLAFQWTDTLHLLTDALRRAKSKDGDAIKAALEATANFKGMQSTYSFAPGKHDGMDPRDVTIAYATKVDDVFYLRVPDAP
jgi:branched-chain amino acid transport system substrate-binding protein